MQRTELPGYYDIYDIPPEPISKKKEGGGESQSPDEMGWQNNRWMNALDELAGAAPVSRELVGHLQAARSEYVAKIETARQRDDRQSLVQVEQSPLFEFGRGFTTYPPPVIENHEEVPKAPLSQEQFRVLLLKQLPAGLTQFLYERVVFDYTMTENNQNQGAQVSFKMGSRNKGDKLVLQLHRSNFITPHKRSRWNEDFYYLGPTDPDRLRVGSVDPAKLIFVIGKTFGCLTAPEPKQIRALIPDESFAATQEIASPRHLERLRNNKDAWAYKQWQDFTGLYLANQRQAESAYPEAAAYLKNAIEKLTDPANDRAMIQRARSLAQDDSGKEIIQFDEFRIIPDLRTLEERTEKAEPKPEYHTIDKGIGLINRLIGLGGYGWALRYSLTEQGYEADPDDEKEVTRIVENYDEKTRERHFAAILMSKNSDKATRRLARRYLLAFSREGEFHDARIYMWLYKFSPTFRNSHPLGNEISGEDYEDLKMIYRTAEKEGNLPGCAILPYFKEEYNPDPNKIDHSPRKASQFTRKPEEYEQLVRRKMHAKSGKAVYEANPKILDCFKLGGRYIEDLNARFDSAALAQKVNDSALSTFVSTYGPILEQLGLPIIPVPARLYAESYQYHLALEGKQNEFMSDKAVDTIRHFGEKLHRADTANLDELFTASAEQIADRATPEELEKHQQDLEREKKVIIQSIATRMRKEGVIDPVVEEAVKILMSGPMSLQGLRNKVNEAIDKLYVGNSPQAEIIKRKTSIFFIDQDINPDLVNLQRISERQEAIKPRFMADLAKAAEELGSKSRLDQLIMRGSVNEERAKKLAQYGVALTESEERQIKEEAAKEFHATDLIKDDSNVAQKDEKADEEAAKKAEAITSEQEITAINKKRAAKLTEKLVAATPEERQKVILAAVADITTNLEASLPHKTGRINPVTGDFASFSQNYDRYIEANPFLKLPTLGRIRSELRSTMVELDDPLTREAGYRNLAQTESRINRAIELTEAKVKKK